MNFMVRFLLNLSITPLPAEELSELYGAFLTEFVLLPYLLKNYMNFMMRFLLNLSITPLPAEELNETYAAFLIKFVYYSLTSWRMK